MRFRKDKANLNAVGFDHVRPYCPTTLGKQRIRSSEPGFHRYTCLSCNHIWESSYSPPYPPCFMEVQQ